MSDLNGLEILFLVCAIVGGAFVLLRIVLQLIGISHDFDVQTDSPDIDHSGADAGFRILSFQSLFAFLLMFGLVGLALSKETELHGYYTAIVAIVSGLISAFIIAAIFKFGYKLQSSGTLDFQKSIGCDGTVYLTIPQEGIGRVQVYTGNRLIELDAKSSDSKEIKTGESIRVVSIQGNILIVEKI